MYLIHGFDPDHPDDEIVDELKERLAKDSSHQNEPSRFKDQDGPFLLIKEASVTLQDVKNLKAIGYIRIGGTDFKIRNDLQCYHPAL